MKGIIIVIAIAIVLVSCTKTETLPPPVKLDTYALVVDWYTLDTVKHLNRVQWNYDSIYSENIKRQFDTSPDMWYIDCNMTDRLQHLYYTKNGKKIQQSVYPKDQTNTNYKN